MILGLLFILLAVALFDMSLSGIILIPILAALFLIYVREFEEPILERRFDGDYIKYRKSVPALLPWKWRK
jgi:protein-S-isoprenylcysteine O-methyltransferase Ste14